MSHYKLTGQRYYECIEVDMVTGNSEGLNLLSELSRKTTAYHDAPVDRMEDARQEYEEALRNFKSAQGSADSATGTASGLWLTA